MPGTTILLYAQKNAQRRTTQHPKTKGKAQHCTAMRWAAELYIAGLTCAWGALSVIQQRNIYKLGVVLMVPVHGMILRMLLACTK